MTHEDYCVFRKLVEICEVRFKGEKEHRHLLGFARMCVHKYERQKTYRERRKAGK